MGVILVGVDIVDGFDGDLLDTHNDDNSHSTLNNLNTIIDVVDIGSEILKDNQSAKSKEGRKPKK